MFCVTRVCAAVTLFIAVDAVLAGCAMRAPPNPTELVAAADVINSVFCGITLAAHQDSTSTLPKYAALTLELKVISSDSVGIGLGSSKPPSFGGGGSSGAAGSGSGGGSVAKTSVVAGQAAALAPGLGLGFNEGWTVDTTTQLAIEITDVDRDNKVCAAINVRDAKSSPDFGLSKYLDTTIKVAAAANRLSGGKTHNVSFTYDANFSVTIQASATTGPVIAIIPLSANADLSKNDVQHLKLVMSDQLPPPPKGNDGGGDNSKFLSEAIHSLRPSATANPVSLRDIEPVPYF